MLDDMDYEYAPLWSSEEVACATDSKPKVLWHAYGVSADLEELEPGDLFISAKGDVEAHKALMQGASGIISETYEAGPYTLKVKNTLQAFIDIAQGARHRTNAAFIGIAGDDAEIIVAQAELGAMLSSYGLTYAPLIEEVSLKNILLALANMPPETEFAILPVPFEEASWLVKPDILLMRDGYDEALSGDVFAGMSAKGTMICGNKLERREVFEAMATTRGIKNHYHYFTRGGLMSACSMTMVQALSVAQKIPQCPFNEEKEISAEEHVSYLLDLTPQRAANDTMREVI